MVKVQFSSALTRHLPSDEYAVPPGTVGEVLRAVFLEQPTVRPYVLDDAGTVRKHVSILVDGKQIQDRQKLTDFVPENSKLHVLQGLPS